MNNLLIVGAGVYGVLASEIAFSMGCFDRIDFIDDNTAAVNGKKVIGKTGDIVALANDYQSIVVAIGNPHIRLQIIEKIKETPINLVSLISPKAYVSPSATVKAGCIVEPMAVIHTGSVIEEGCIISAGAVINHLSTCEQGVHVDCNATVKGYLTVPALKKINSGEVYES